MRNLISLFLAATAVCALGPHIYASTVYITFDDGPANATAGVLDVLREAGVKATFFLTGENSNAITGGVPKQKELFLKILADGHGVGNHCFRHKPETKGEYETAYGKTAFQSEGQRAAFRQNYFANEQHFQQLGGDQLFAFKIARLPGDGRTFPHLLAETAKLGLKHYGWQFEIAPNGTFAHVNNKDWQNIAGVSATSPMLPTDGNIILFHDFHWGGDHLVLLRKVIQLLKDKNYSFKLLYL